MHISRFVLGELQSNCYLLSEENEALIIDPGEGITEVLEELVRRNLTLVGMLATHGHFDHILGAGEAQASFHVPLFVDKRDLFLVKRMVKTVQHFLSAPVILPIREITHSLPYFHKFSYEIIYTPGHTPGSVTYYFPTENALFCGDTLFADGLGSTEHGYSSETDLFESIKKLNSYEGIFYPGHGDSFGAKREPT